MEPEVQGFEVEPEVPEVVAPDVAEPEIAEPPSDAWEAAPAGPLARAARDQKPPPSTARKTKPEPENPKPKRVPRRQRDKQEQPADATRDAVAPPPTPPTPAPEPRVAAMAAAKTAAAPQPAPVDREIEDAKAHEDALEMFIRLTESDRQPHDTSTVDQGAVRAALARTAARKKLGGERLQPHDERSGESRGGPPRSK
jgi:hypothetical protein